MKKYTNKDEIIASVMEDIGEYMEMVDDPGMLLAKALANVMVGLYQEIDFLERRIAAREAMDYANSRR